MKRFLEAGFLLLGSAEPRELVLGLVGRPWRLSPQVLRIKPEQFVAFKEPGQVKVAMNFSIEPLGSGHCQLSTETRIAATNQAARRRFLPYWILIRPFSGLIRREMLRAISCQAQKQKN